MFNVNITLYTPNSFFGRSRPREYVIVFWWIKLDQLEVAIKSSQIKYLCISYAVNIYT